MDIYKIQPAYTSKTKRRECKNQGCRNDVSQKVNSAYCDKCLELNKKIDDYAKEKNN